MAVARQMAVDLQMAAAQMWHHRGNGHNPEVAAAKKWGSRQGGTDNLARHAGNDP